MGKSKPRTRDRARNRNNPAGKPVKPPSDPELAAIREQRILPVLKDLQSAELKTRSAAASAISNIIEDAKCRKLLLREQIVKILFEQTLTDSSLETRAAGWGILTNLALEEEADFCVHLYRQDVLTSIEGVVRTTISSQDPQFASVPKGEQNLVWSLTRSIVNLLTSLCEAQEEILEAVSAISSIKHFLFGLLSYELAPADVQQEALSCLTALTEDNKPLAESIAGENGGLKELLELKDGSDLRAVGACGVLHNVFASLEWFDHNTEKDGLSDALLISTLTKALSQDSNAMSDTAASNPDQILRLALEVTASIATTLQEALEHASGYEKTFEGFDDKIEDDGEDDKMEDDDEELQDGDNNDDDDDDNGEMNDEEIDADMQLVTGNGSDDEGDEEDEVTLDLLVRNAAPQVLRLACTPSTSSEEGESIQIHALSALNNIAWTVSSIDFAKSRLGAIKKFWSSLAYKIWDEIVSPVLASNTADIELASSVTSLAWAVSRSVHGAVNLKPEEQRKFMALYQASKNIPPTEGQSNGTKQASSDESDVFQSLGVKSVGVLGSLARDPAPVELNKEIGIFLLTVLSSLPETQPAVAVEALDQIFDIYADKSYEFDEPVFWGAGFYKHLEEILPKVKKMAKGIDKRKHEELRSRADEAALNLTRFLKYKRTEKQGK